MESGDCCLQIIAQSTIRKIGEPLVVVAQGNLSQILAQNHNQYFWQ